MKFQTRYAIFMIVCLFLFACHGSKNEITIVNRNFEDVIDQQQNLVFSFNKDIFPDTLVARWDSTAYIEITPKVKGQFKWNSSSELMFSPSERFEPGTEYTGKLSKRILKYADKKYWISNSKDIHFHTAPLLVNNAHLSWTRGKSMSNVIVQLDMDFNYEVKVSDAAARIKLSSNGNPINFTMVNSGNGKTVTLQFMPVNDLDQETPLKIEAAKGIPLATGKYISIKDTVIMASIPSRYSLAVTGMTAQHTGTEGIITVNTSQPMLEENLKNMVTLEPAVPFELAITDAGFILNSKNLKSDQTYILNISANVQGAFGGKMKKDYSEQVVFGKLQPSINFTNTKGMYLSSQGYRNVALSIVNVPNVEVTVVKVYENNLEFFMRKGTRYGYDYSRDGDDNDGGDFRYYDTENLGDTVFHKTYETSKLPQQNAARLLHLDFQDKIKDYKGVYIITVASKEHRWVQESKVLSISDIGLIVKQEQDNIYVFANSIKKATALSGVKVSFVSTTNQQLYSAVTDNDGMATFKNISSTSPGFDVGLVTAKMDDEFSFVLFDKSRIETSRFDVGGRELNATGLNVMLYAERNLYRPGEPIHVSAIVRSEQWGNPGEIPLKLKLTMPNGKEFATMRKILNEQGSCETVFNMPATTMTGTYTLEAYTGNDVLLNSYDISIEEFMPDRIKVALVMDRQEYKLGDSVKTNIQADNLFGTPAAGRNYDCEMNLDKAIFTAKGYPDYSFALENNFNFNADTHNGETDTKGAIHESFILHNEIADIGLIKGNIMCTVFDETGRPVHRYEHFSVYTRSVFVGIKDIEGYINTRKPLKINLIAVSKDGIALNGKNAEVSIIRKEWHTVIQQDGARYKYVSQKDEKLVSQRSVTINGTTTGIYYTPELSGEYEIRVSIPGSESYVSKTFYAWGDGDTQYTSFEVNNEGNVTIKTDKEKYRTGENMNLLFTTPFEGRMLVTVERDKVIRHYYLNTQNRSASLSVKADDEGVPNVYITATLFRPMEGDNMPLTVAHGYKPITIENPQNHLPVTIGVAARSLSKTKQTITVRTAPGALVTVAAVDEGILQVKNYKTPDPYEYFYQKVALSVNSFDIYPWLLPEIKFGRSSTGGDGGDASSMRVNPNFVNRVKLVTFWSGILLADGSGIARYNIDIPQFSGDLRVMAVAYKGKAFGGTDQHIKVADPIVISTALPRFLSPKDEVVMSISVSNTTAREANATITVQVTGPLTVTSNATQNVKIPANREGRAVFNIAAQQAIGPCKVNVIVKAMNETFTNETEIGIRPPASLQKLTGSGLASSDETGMISARSNFITSTYRGKLVVSKSPLVQFSKNMDYLVHYPYGCVEQTVSAAFPQLYYSDLVKSISGKESSDMNSAYNVQQAILKLQSMQLSNGALSYWPEAGDGNESWWGSVYTANFLLEAKKAGFQVNEHTLERLLAYLKVKLNKKETEIYYYNENLKKEIAAKEIAYSLYVLSAAGQPQVNTMNYYKAHMEMLSLDSKYMLAAAYTLAGQPMQSSQVLPPAFTGERSVRSFGGSFYSYIRDEAISLNAMLDIDPNNVQVGIMAKQLSQQLKDEPYLNTQENAFSILAMGKVARMTNKTTATAVVTSNGKTVGNTKGDDLNLDLRQFNSQTLNVKVTGKGRYYYFWEQSGITADGTYKQEDSYMKVRRTYFDRKGNEITNNTFHQNDLIIVRISIEGQFNGTINNVAITDMLPAGFEIENNRLSDLPEIKWIKNETKPDYLDVRDDRINFFTSAGARKDLYYMVRAVSPGVYQLGPVQADAMYNGMYHSYNGAGVVRIEQ